MHFVDEGAGEPLVFVHGNPAWSFEFRDLIEGLRSEFRCIAPDQSVSVSLHEAAGVKTTTREPREPVRRPSRSPRRSRHHPVPDRLGRTNRPRLRAPPAGPGQAHRHLEHLVLAGRGDFHFRSFSYLMSSWFAQYLVRYHNVFVRRIMRQAVGDRRVLTRRSWRTPERAALAEGACRERGAAGPYRRRDRLAAFSLERTRAFTDKPTLILWGFEDIAFRRKELERWKSELTDFELHEFEDCGHFLAEEAPERLLPVLRDFLARA